MNAKTLEKRHDCLNVYRSIKKLFNKKSPLNKKYLRNFDVTSHVHWCDRCRGLDFAPEVE